VYAIHLALRYIKLNGLTHAWLWLCKVEGTAKLMESYLVTGIVIQRAVLELSVGCNKLRYSVVMVFSFMATTK
jgi:hypothetical protein